MHEALNHAKLAMLFRKEFELCNVRKGETIVLLSDLLGRRKRGRDVIPPRPEIAQQHDGLALAHVAKL